MVQIVGVKTPKSGVHIVDDIGHIQIVVDLSASSLLFWHLLSGLPLPLGADLLTEGQKRLDLLQA
jgi:hypothetical protein